jgi:hypothetical protein
MPSIASNFVRKALALGVLIITGAAGLAEESGAQWILVTPPEFREALTPLIQHRQAQGFKVVVLQTTDVLTPEQLRERDGAPLQAKLNDLYRQNKGRNYVLLAGIFGADNLTNAISPVVPALRGEVGRMKGEPSDSGYGLPAHDGTPTAAVGRFPARDREEVGAMVQKTLAFERNGGPALWRNRLTLFIGDPGGGPLAEMFVQQALATDLASLHPSWEVRMLFNVASSPFYLPRPRDREAAQRYLGEGNLFTIYLGHSYAAGLGMDGKFVTRADWAKVSIPQGAGPFFTCGCFACQSDAQGDGYGLAAMRNPAGPVAVIGATGDSHGVAGKLAAEGLLAGLKQPPFPSRLGDYWLGVAAGLARGKMDEAMFALLDMADGSNGKMPLAAQRREHLEMWLLLGDPALRLPVMPVDISVQSAQNISAGQDAEVRGLLPDSLKGAMVRVSLERPLNSVPTVLAEVPPNTRTNRDARERAFIARHQSANSFVLTSADVRASGTHFVASLKVPASLPWSNVVVRASAVLSNETGMGVVAVPVKR